jgi:predicted phage terminase large subunit-like protein
MSVGNAASPSSPRSTTATLSTAPRAGGRSASEAASSSHDHASSAAPSSRPALVAIAVSDASTSGAVGQVINLAVEGTPEFFANGILTHNCDELAAFRYTATWDMLMMGLRLGDRPQCVVTTTPRPTHLMQGLVSRGDVIVTRGSTFDNAANLAPAALEQLRRRYSGTRLGLQELEGQLLEEAEGALWQREWIESSRVNRSPLKGYKVKVLALDPADGRDDGDEQAWCLAGLGLDQHLYIADSEGMRVTPLKWLKAAILLAHEEQATIIIEKNHGGAFLVELLEQAMKELGVRVPYLIVTASKGKATRAEPVAMLFEQGATTGKPIAHMIGNHPELEDQMCNWTGEPGQPSPDRLDAAVWAFSHLLGYSRQPAALGADQAVPYRDHKGPGMAVQWR